MAMREFAAAKPRPLPVIILADTSGSMSIDGKMEALNLALKDMLISFGKESHLNAVIQVAIIAFGGENASMILPLTSADEISGMQDLVASGRTPMGSAMAMAKELLEDKELIPSRAYKPTLVLVSDGNPTDNWEQPFAELQESERASKAVRMAMGIGADANIHMLKQFINDLETPVFKAHDAKDISRFFRAVSMSVTLRSRSTKPNQINKIDFNDISTDDELDLSDFD